MAYVLGIDTSNYTSSLALYNSGDGSYTQKKRLLPVVPGALGLRQSDAVFAHVKQLGELAEQLFAECRPAVAAVGVSASPRDEQGSYMPCFLVGEMCARLLSAALGVPLFSFSHQAGHVAAALHSAGKLEYTNREFLAFHISGGTTQCLLVKPDGERVFRIETVAQTLDLHAGQAVDRVGNMLGLPFPAGPALERLALTCEDRYSPRPAFKGADCCLSGLQNRCERMLAEGGTPAQVARYCLDYLAQVLLEMTRQAVEMYPELPIVFSGGVMSNSIIRDAIGARYHAVFAEPALSADNAVGAAVLAALRQAAREGGKP